MKFTISSVDYAPPDLESQTPFSARLRRQIPGSDRPDYWVADLEAPLVWEKDGNTMTIEHLVVCARWEGTQIGRGMKDMPVNIAYVIDVSVLSDSELDFAKCEYIAIGTASEVEED